MESERSNEPPPVEPNPTPTGDQSYTGVCVFICVGLFLIGWTAAVICYRQGFSNGRKEGHEEGRTEECREWLKSGNIPPHLHRPWMREGWYRVRQLTVEELKTLGAEEGR